MAPWHLADYLDQHGRRARRELIPPEAFWLAAAAYADPADLAQAAENRGLYRDAARLYKKASGHGNATAGTNLVRLLRTVHPGDQRPADWVAAHASLDDPPGVTGLLDQLRAVGANGQVAALGRRAAAHTSLDSRAAWPGYWRRCIRWGPPARSPSWPAAPPLTPA